MPGAMTGGAGVRRSESLNSNRSDLSHKKVSFNKDVSVKRIPRGALMDRNGQLIAVMPESADPKVWFASRRAEKLNPDDIAREAQEILTQLDQVTCAASASPFQEHPHSKSHYSIPANNMYDPGSSYSKTLPNPHKKNNIESKNNKLKNIADKNKINKESSKNKGSTSSTEKRRKSLETILESGGQNGYINLNSLSKTSSLNNVNESAFSDSDYYAANEKFTKRIHPSKTSPTNDMRKDSPSFKELQGNSGVKALVSHFNEESQRRQQPSHSGGFVPTAGMVEPSRDINHNNNVPFSYLRPPSSPEPELLSDTYYDEGVDEVDTGREHLKSPREVVYAQVVVKNKDKSKFSEAKDKDSKEALRDNWHEGKENKSVNYGGTKYTNTRQYSPDRYTNTRQYSPDRYTNTRQYSPDRYTPSTFPRPKHAEKKLTDTKVYSATNTRSKSPAKEKMQMRISNDNTGKTKIYLTSQEAKNKNISTHPKHVARINLNSPSSPKREPTDRVSPERHYYYGDSGLNKKPGHRPIVKTSSDASSSAVRPSTTHNRSRIHSDSSVKTKNSGGDLTSMRLVKQANEKSFTKSKPISKTEKSEHTRSYISNRPVKEVQSEGEDKKRKKVKITFHDKPSRTDSDIENLKGFVEYKGQGDKEGKIQRSRKHFLSAFLEKAPRAPLNFRKKAAKTTNRKTSDPFDSDTQMVWSSPGEDMDDVVRYSNSDSGHKVAPKLWFSSEDLGWPGAVDSSFTTRPPEKKLLSPPSKEPPRSHSLDRRPNSPGVVAHRSPNYLSRMNRYLSETDRESASQFSGSDVGGLKRRRPGASMGELSTDSRQRRGGSGNKEPINEAQRRRRIRLKRSASSAAILNPRDPISSTGSTANSSESENGTTSGNSGRSVYLHAMTIADIPPLTTRAGSSILSKDELIEKPGRQRQSRSVTRSSSVAAPWKPKTFKEPFDVNYNTDGRPPRPPRKRDKLQENVVIEKVGQGPNAVRRVQTNRDGAKLAGWFRKKKEREPSPSPTSEPKKDVRRR